MSDSNSLPLSIPRDTSFDSTLALKREGYDFIRNRCQQMNSDLFETRLLMKPTICILGHEAAKIFYDENKFQRGGAAPTRLKKTLFGQQGVQGLDGEEHRHRKAMFMNLMTKDSLDELVQITHSYWRAAINDWHLSDSPVMLKEAVAELLTQSICHWAGVPLEDDKVKQRSHQFIHMIEGASKVGFRHWQGRHARRLTERWCRNLIHQTRTNQITVEPEKALYKIAMHQQLDKSLLSEQVAAVELLNVLRPTVAITYYVVLTALALHQFPHETERLDSHMARHRFVQEVRRFYPFFPAAVAEVKQTFEWQGYTFPQGRRVMLDLHGTNHDHRLWQNPEQFWPDRFLSNNNDEFSLIPQGGGDYWQHHRCAGEWLTLAMMEVALKVLTQEIQYDVNSQNLFVPHNKMPTLPESGFKLYKVRPVSTVS